MIYLFLGACLSCSTTRRRFEGEASTSPPTREHGWKAIDVNRVNSLVLAVETNRHFSGYCTVTNTDFARKLFADMALQPPSNTKVYTFVAPSLLAFRDSNGAILCGFLYWPGGKPCNIFRPVDADVANNIYTFRERSDGEASFSLPDFDKRMKLFLDVWNR